MKLDPNRNLLKQENIIQGTAKGNLLDLRYELWDWLQAGGLEPAWSRAPLAAKEYQHYIARHTY